MQKKITITLITSTMQHSLWLSYAHVQNLHKSKSVEIICEVTVWLKSPLDFFPPLIPFCLSDVLIARRLVSHCCHGSGRGGREGAAVAVAPRSAGGDGVPQHGNPAAPGQPALLSRCQQCQRVPLPDGPLLWGDRLLHLLLRAVVWVQFIFTVFTDSVLDTALLLFRDHRNTCQVKS